MARSVLSAIVLGLFLSTNAHAGTDPGASCKDAKAKASGKKASALLKAYGKNVKKADGTRLAASISKAESKFTKSFAKAEGKGGCLTSGDVTPMEITVDCFVLDAVRDLTPPSVIGEVFDVPSPAEPAETPGSPSVVVTNPDLITQFGGSGFDLNFVRYTRWRFAGPVQPPDAVLLLVAGFGGDANNFKAMAEDLIPRVLADHGLVLEVWGFHRRTNQLEDREGIAIATAERDPLIALDWYYGGDLGLTLHPALAAGPNRRAFFYNTSDDIPFIANFTELVHSRDINAVVDVAATIAANGNVFLGGHSAGTGFTARYAATDFNLTGIGSPDPGYAKLRGLVLLEGGGGSVGPAVSADTLDRIEDKFDGGLFAAVRDAAPRCVDGTPCTTDADCAGNGGHETCTPTTTAYAAILGLSPQITATSEPSALQRLCDPDRGQVILQVDQGAPGNNAVDVVPELALLGALPPSTVDGLLGTFIDDDGVGAGLSPAIATSIGAPGPVVGGLATWIGLGDGVPMPLSVLPNNGPPPVSLPATRWGQEKEVVKLGRYADQFLANGYNAADWYYSSAGLSMTSVSGLCDGATCDVGGTDQCVGGPNNGAACTDDEDCGLCSAGDVGAPCDSNGDCSQSLGLDTTQLSVGRSRRDIANQTEAANIDIPVICFGGSNGLTPTPSSYVPFAQSIGTCTAPSCDGTARVVDASLPNPAFPTFGNVNGGFEVHISEGFAHQDIVVAEDDANNNVLGPLSDFIARNVQ